MDLNTKLTGPDPGVEPADPRRAGVIVAPDTLYWRERFPVEKERLTVSRDALRTLYAIHSDHKDRRTYPWRLGLNPGTGLPAFLRTHLLQGSLMEDHPEEAHTRIAVLLTEDNHARALFGVTAKADGFGEEFAPEPSIRLNGSKAAEGRAALHFAWSQRYQRYPVIGGGVRVHGIIGSDRVAVTSSYFPIPRTRIFTPTVPPEQVEWRALLALSTQPHARARLPVLATLFEYSQALGHGTPAEHGLAQTDDQSNRAVWAQAQRAMAIAIVQIGGSDYALLPFAGDYRLIRRVRIELPDQDAWYVDVDVEHARAETGVVFGQPWQMAARTPMFYAASQEVVDGLGVAPPDPTGLTGAIDAGESASYLELFDSVTPVTTPAGLQAASIEATTVAGHAQRLYRHFRDVCGIPETTLQGYTYRDVIGAMQTQSPGLRARVNVEATTGFSYDQAVHPKPIRFEQDSGAGIPADGHRVFTPGRDPEVVLHELTHGFLWLLNRDPWDTPPTLGPFGLALQEGYAMYLARSVAAGNDAQEAQQPWARAAYRPADWGNDTWRLSRTGKKVGEDLLPAPNIYPSGSFSTESLEVYDTGMIWARALWDLRRILGPERADWLAIHAYPYLHGYVANFELAAEGLIQADLQLTGLNLGNGTQPIWAGRGIAAGQGVNGFARATNGVWVAAADAGILRSEDGGQTWLAETANLAQPGLPMRTLTGVVAVTADGNIFYAAAQLPPNATAGVGTQWDSGVFWRDAAVPGSSWAPIPGWPVDATPLSLRMIRPGRVAIGTSRGVFAWDHPTQILTAPTATHFAVLGLASVIAATGAQRVRVCSPTSLYQCDPTGMPDQWAWNAALAGLFGGDPAVRLTGVAAIGNQLYVGALDGLWTVLLNWSAPNAATRSQRITDAVLTLTTDGNRLYVATAQEVAYSDDAGQTFTSRGLPDPNATVTSMFATGGAVWVGTLAHGIWQRSAGGAWIQRYAPALPRIPVLERSEQALLSVMLPTANARCRINMQQAPGLVLVQVFQPGFPLRVAAPDLKGAYDLAQGPVLLLVENPGLNPLPSLGVSVAPNGDVSVSTA